MKGNGWTIFYDHTEGKAVNQDIKQGEHEIPFRLFDDDGELYYSGSMHPQLYDSYAILAPLDWAMYYAGCTEMHVCGPNENGEWSRV